MASRLYTSSFQGASGVPREPQPRGGDTLQSLPLMRRGLLILLVIAPLGLACSGGYGPQPSGTGGWYTPAGTGNSAGSGTGGGGAAAVGGSSADTAGTGGASAVAGGGGSAGNGGTTGAGGSAGTLSPVAPPACDALGPEPTIPTACATLLATKTLVAGSPSDETLDSAAIQAAI